MVPCRPDEAENTFRFPRARGDGPHDALHHAEVSEVPPPARGKQKELELKHHRVSHNRHALRNVLMASSVAAVLAAGGSIRAASAHAHHGLMRSDGNHADHSMRIGETGAWRHNQHGRRGVRAKLLGSPIRTERSIEHSTESRRSFEGSGIASVYGGQHAYSRGHGMRDV
jgi:hypothetical protein